MMNVQKLKTNFIFAEDFLALLDVWTELIQSMYKLSAAMQVSRLFAIARPPKENKNVDI